jgi:hypothetical protein
LVPDTGNLARTCFAGQELRSYKWELDAEWELDAVGVESDSAGTRFDDLWTLDRSIGYFGRAGPCRRAGNQDSPKTLLTAMIGLIVLVATGLNARCDANCPARGADNDA